MSDKITGEQLTAYVLNELNNKERKRIEKAVQNDPELMKEVKTLKAFCQTVKYGLLEEPLPTLTDFQRRSVRNKLVEEPVNKKYKIKNLFKWKIMVPAACVSVLALVIFLNVPDQILSKKDVAGSKQFTAKNDSFVSSARSGAKIAGNIEKTDKDKPLINRDKYFTDKIASNYLKERSSGNIGGKSLFDNNFASKKSLLRRSNPMQLINNGAEPRYASPHYDLENFDIVFRNKTKPLADNSSYVVPISMDVASYDNVRHILNNNQMPPKDTVKIEEMINYFDYNYSSSDQDMPFSIITEISKIPWNNKHKLMHIGFKGRKTIEKNTPNSNEFSKPITTAKNVKIRLEFNPDKIKAYRLIGYEAMNFDKKDICHNCEIFVKDLYAGQIGTVLYELIPTNSGGTLKSNKIMTLKLGYKLPYKDQWRIFIYPVAERYVQFDQTSDNFRFSAAVAAFGMLLKNPDHNRNLSYSDVINIAKGSKGKDQKGHRAKFIRLVEIARSLDKKN